MIVVTMVASSSRSSSLFGETASDTGDLELGAESWVVGQAGGQSLLNIEGDGSGHIVEGLVAVPLELSC